MRAGYDSSGLQREIVVGLSSKANIEDNDYHMNLYKIIDLDSKDIKMVSMAKSVFQFNLKDTNDQFAQPAISFKNGNFIWSSYEGENLFDTIQMMRICGIGSRYDSETGSCYACDNNFIAFSFQDPTCVLCLNNYGIMYSYIANKYCLPGNDGVPSIEDLIVEENETKESVTEESEEM